jgi:hypothetical protein
VRAIWRDGEPVSVAVLRRLGEDARSSQFAVPELVFTNLRDSYWAGEGIPGLTAIETWARAAVNDFLGDGDLSVEGPALRWSRDSQTEMLAWHEMTAVLIPVGRGDRELIIEYEQAASDCERERVLVKGRHEPLQTFIDWRLYAGSNTAIGDGEAPLNRRQRAKIWLDKRLGGAEGVVLGKVHKQLGPLDNVNEKDPDWPGRAVRLEERYPALAQQYPRLGLGDRLTGETGAIIVHGTRSCSMLALLELNKYLQLPARRYEHDTFRPLVDNAEELAALIETTVDCNRVILIAHSRGGLVARLATDLLRRNGFAGAVEVWTFGTPHLGTPLVGRSLKIMAKVLGVKTKVTKVARAGVSLTLDTLTDEFGIPIEDPASAAFALLLRSSGIPPGIEAMGLKNGRPDQVLRMIPAGTTYASFGAVCDFDSVPVGYTVIKARRRTAFAREVFGGEPNDLVVGISSSTAATGPRRLSDPCGHSEYFRDPTVKAELSAL